MTHQPGDPPANPLNLLRTKLFIPRPHADIVDLPRLKLQLDRALTSRLTVIAAPAGYGKTTLLSKWLGERKLDAAWVSLDERDNDPVRFWSYLLAALNTHHPNTGQVAQAMLQSPQTPPIETILTSLLNDLVLIEHGFYMVLDDYHAITNPDIHQGITFLLQKMPSQMHLIISSRSDPPLLLPQLRARRDLVELGPPDLRFTNQEATAFLNRVMQLNLSAGDISLLETQTEGWVAGLQLAALTLQGAPDTDSVIQNFSGSHRFVFDFLAQEVLSKQPVEVQEFLLQTSLLERMCASLCDAVTAKEGSQRILESLEHDRLFLVSLDSQRQWYRYHHLFAEFLQTQLIKTESRPQPGAADLHRRASAWLEERGLYIDAFDHAFQAGDFDNLSRLIEDHASVLFDQSELITLLTWMDRQPVEQFKGRPALSIICAWAHLATSRFEAVEQYLGYAEAALDAAADGSPVKDNTLCLPLGEIACIRANLAFHSYNFSRVLELTEIAEDYLDSATEDRYFHNAGSLKAVVTFNRALVSEYLGNTPEAIRAFEETIRLSREWHNPHLLAMSISHLGHLKMIQGEQIQTAQFYLSSLEKSKSSASPPTPIIGMIQANLGTIYYEWNDLDSARQHLEKSIEQGRLWANWETLLPGYIGLARVWNAVGDLPRALRVHDELAEFASKLPTHISRLAAQAERARLLSSAGDTTPVQEWMRSCPVKVGEAIPFVYEVEAIYLARFLVDLGQYSTALKLIGDLIATIKPAGRLGRLLEVLVIQGLAHQACGEFIQAADDIQQALVLAEPQGAVRTFLDAGPALLPLLAEVAGDQAVYARKILEAGSLPGGWKDHAGTITSSAGGSGQLLSEREQQVLRLVAEGYTNREIADSLVISLNTVKSHLKNILACLQVSNRTQAATRARELGLI